MHQSQSSLIGRTIDDRYEVLDRIGEGGMGVVYKARQKSIDRVIAIKMLNPHMARDPSWVQRFYNEAKACSRLQHPNTIRMFDFGQTREGQLFMTMEFLDGQSLRQAIARSSPMDALRVLKILVQCCGSLSEAHNLGIIHRDIKPDNVFLLNLAGSPDHVKLLDFSVAKLLQENEGMRTQAGVVFGTPEYMSPEQGRGQPLDARSDLYALGILAFEMLTGDVPFQDPNPMNVLQMHLRSQIPPLPPNVHPMARTVVTRCLEKDPNRRYQSAVEMMTHCQQVIAALTGATPPSLQPLGMPRPQRASQPPPMSSAPQARTILADQSQLPLPNNAQKKTVMADMSQMPGGPPPPMGGPPPAVGASQPMPQGQPMYPQLQGDVKKTMLLEDSSGIVSYANRGGQASGIDIPPTDQTNYLDEPEGASLLFWIVCLLMGLGVGVGAYLLVLELS